MVSLEERGHLRRQRVQLVEDHLDLVGRERLSHLGELERDQREQRHLRGEGLRRGDPDLEPAAREERGVDLARDLRAHHVRDRERAGVLFAGKPHRCERVGRLAGLGDPDHERVPREDRVAVAPLAGDVRLDRNPRPLLDDVAADHAGVVGRPAGEDHDTAEVPQLLVSEAETLEDEVPVPHTVAERLLDRVRLLVDLLEHERLVAGFLRRLVVPVDLERLAHDLAVLDVDEARALRGNRHDLAVVDQLDPPRLAEEGDRRGGKEHLPVAGADEQRALLAGSDELARMVVMDDDECEVPFELLVGRENGIA